MSKLIEIDGEMFQVMTDEELIDLAKRASNGEELSNAEVQELGAFATWMWNKMKKLEDELEKTKDLIQETRDLCHEIDLGERDLMTD